MASRKRKLTRAQVAALLAQSSDSETYDSEFDNSDNDSDSDDSDQTVDYTYHHNTTDFDWSATVSWPRTMFSGKSGLQVALDNPDDPLAFFSLFFTPEILNVIVTETNRRAAQLISQMRARPMLVWIIGCQCQWNTCFHRGAFIMKLFLYMVSLLSLDCKVSGWAQTSQLHARFGWLLQVVYWNRI